MSADQEEGFAAEATRGLAEHAKGCPSCAAALPRIRAFTGELEELLRRHSMDGFLAVVMEGAATLPVAAALDPALAERLEEIAANAAAVAVASAAGAIARGHA